MLPAYIDTVEAQIQRNPCLQAPGQFLRTPPSEKACVTACIEIRSTDDSPRGIYLDFLSLASLLEKRGWLEAEEPLGRLLFVQDPDSKLVGLLGNAFNIDPMFFCNTYLPALFPWLVF